MLKNVTRMLDLRGVKWNAEEQINAIYKEVQEDLKGTIVHRQLIPCDASVNRAILMIDYE